ncbi:peptide chain release factor 1 [Fidelibacter multiformis]|jgi:peptide chain release factor 1|uniref:peptide chain release factor 1 n=1 Tax=Fidelibacter multiformis TaxID=3377529 RepID=UPI0037DC466B
MREKLEHIKIRYHEILETLADPDIFRDQERYKQLTRDQKNLEPIVQATEKYEKLLDHIHEDEQILRGNDAELKQIVREELDDLLAEKESMEEHLKFLLIPKDPNDDRNTILEIRSGTGGDEAALFAADLYRMYTRYAERQGWKVEVLASSELGIGGLKEISMLITGQSVYSKLKYESGVHRVQRVPVTESSGRIHTSAATVAVLPEMDDVDVEIDEKDIRIDTYRASGHGGQHVNKTDSAIRITHFPTGIVVTCQDESSQHKNKEKALKILYSRVYTEMAEAQQKSIAEERKSQVSTGDRSAKIRTYNFPQGRITDHRINYTAHNLPAVMEGDLDELIEELTLADNMEKLKNL